MDNDKEALIRVKNLKKAYKQVKVLDGINLAVQKGGVCALLGPNGAGKTTMVRILATLLKPDEGQITISGIDLLREPGKVRQLISLTGQFAAVDELLTGEENMWMIGKLSHLSTRENLRRTSELLEQFELTEAAKRRVKLYSGGMRRRLDLAISLIAAPPIIFLDEPTTGLDPHSRIALWEKIGELVTRGHTIFLTTQYLEEADYLANQIVVINNGRVIAEGTPDELKQQIGKERLELVVCSASDLEKTCKVLDGQVLEHDAQKRSISVPLDGGARQLKKILELMELANIEIETIFLHKPTLDDVFLTLTSRQIAYSAGVN